MGTFNTEVGESVLLPAEGGTEVVEDPQKFLDTLRVLAVPRGNRGDAAEAGAVVRPSLPAVEAGRDERADIRGGSDPLRLEADANIAVQLRQPIRVAAD